jgi:hypothetical protein
MKEDTNDELSPFLITSIGALFSAAFTICKPTRDPYGWAWALLSVAAEKASYEARQHMTPERYDDLRQVVAGHVALCKRAADKLSAERAVGARVVADALGAVETPPEVPARR